MRIQRASTSSHIVERTSAPGAGQLLAQQMVRYEYCCTRCALRCARPAATPRPDRARAYLGGKTVWRSPVRFDRRTYNIYSEFGRVETRVPPASYGTMT
jgi:hypothetical protein